MKFTLSWLKEHLETEASLAAILEGLTKVGLEVEGVEDPTEKLGAFRIARVLSAAPHPQADKLQVLSVDAGEGEPLQIVCGAPNARAGLVGVLGRPGDYVPGLGDPEGCSHSRSRIAWHDVLDARTRAGRVA